MASSRLFHTKRSGHFHACTSNTPSLESALDVSLLPRKKLKRHCRTDDHTTGKWVWPIPAGMDFLPVSRPYDLLITLGPARAWTPALQPVWRPALHSGDTTIIRSRYQGPRGMRAGARRFSGQNSHFLGDSLIFLIMPPALGARPRSFRAARPIRIALGRCSR
jgi:hypothetical protein